MRGDNKISFHWGDDSLLINLGNRIEPRIKALFWIEFLLTVGWATIFMVRAIPLHGDIMNTLECTGAVILYLLASYRFLSRIFYSEKLIVRLHVLEIVTRTPFSYKARIFEWKHMGPLHYVGQEKKTDHPLAGKCYDYYGFETREKLIHRLHNEGNMYFNYGGFPIRFGRGVYSWTAEEVVNMMKLYVGNRLLLGPEWEQMVQEHEIDN